MQKLAILATVAVSLSGCVEPEHAASPVLIDLLSHGHSATHGRDTEAWLYPETDVSWIPASCKAMWGGVIWPGETCEVKLPGEGLWDPVEERNWGLHSQWGPADGRAGEKTARAFNADGVLVAVWSGEAHPEAWYMTE